MTKKMNLAFSHQKDVECARKELAHVRAGTTSEDPPCDCMGNHTVNYEDRVGPNPPPATRPKLPKPDPSDTGAPACDCGWSPTTFWGMSD